MFSARSRFIALVLGLAPFTPFAQAVPSVVNYQGRLTDNSPSQTPLSGVYPVRFDVYDAQTAGVSQWNETDSVTVTAGIFNVQLGAGTAFPAALFSGGATRYLQLTLNPGASQEILTPRQRIGEVGYANVASTAALAASAATATALSANGANCPAGQFPLGVDASGAAEGCTLAGTGTVTSITAGSGLSGGTITGSGTISLTTPVAVASGGTGSTTQNFVDLTTAQTIAGTKTFSSAIAGSITGNAATATTSSQLGGIISTSWQRALTPTSTCTTGFFTGLTQLGALTCGNVVSGSITPPITLSGNLTTPIISGTNSGATSPGSSGVYGENSSTASTVFGVHGKISSTTPGGNSAGVRGENLGTAGSGIGVWGSQAGNGYGVYGTTASGYGVYGSAATGTGVYGSGTTGVYGTSPTNGAAGVYGTNTNASGGYGVEGVVASGQAIYGDATTSGYGVHGQSASGLAVYGQSDTGTAGYFWNVNAANVNNAVFATTAGTGSGVFGENSSTNSPVYGVHGVISSAAGGSSAAGVFGENMTTPGAGGYGVYGTHAGSGTGVWGSANGATGIGVEAHAFASSGASYGVFAGNASSGGIAGYFINSNGGTALKANSTGNGLIFDGVNTGASKFNLDHLGTANFGNVTRQMLNLWGAPDVSDTSVYGIGVQSSTEYFRSGGGFAWYLNGTHSDTQNDPGAGGAALMSLSSGGVLAITTLGSAGATALCRNASNQISTCSSSLRYKTNLKPFSGGLDLLDRLKPITFDWKIDHMPDVGFGAEDVAAVDPLFVTYNAQGQIEGVKYDRLTVILTNAVREQQAQIKAQQSEIDALKAILCADHPDAGMCAGKP